MSDRVGLSIASFCPWRRVLTSTIFLVPPMLWLCICLDSGANKSCIITALFDLMSTYEKMLEADDRKVAEEEELEEEDN